MKPQLLEKLEQLLVAEDVMSIREAVRQVMNDWKAETAKDRLVQQEEFKAAGHPEGTEFEYSPHELDDKFQEQVKIYRDRIDQEGKRLAAERLANLETKTALLDELEKVNKEEQNVGKAFSGFNAVKEKWSATGDVPGDKYHELQDRYSKLQQDFFYNINIYKSLQEHDLKINHKKKEELIGRAKEILQLKSINEIELLTRAYQREWMEIGPSPRETYKDLGDSFFAIIREGQQKVQAHYDELRSHSEENLAKKRALVDKMREILGMELTNVSSWNKWSDEVIRLQEEWRSVGFAPKKENEEIWNEFRGLCDLHFGRKKSFFEEKRSVYATNKQKKEELITQAREWQDSADWKAATEALRKFQEDWKVLGAADQRDEQKLWQRFRSACDVFFTRKKEHFAGQNDAQEENFKLKDALILEIEAVELGSDRNQNMGVLREFQDRWNAIGFIPKEKLKETFERYKKAIDSKYDQVKLEREEMVMNQFRNRLDDMRGGSDGDHKVRRERQFLKEKIDRLHQDKMQYQNNVLFFTGKGAEAMRKEVERKIEQTDREISELKKKLDMMSA